MRKHYEKIICLCCFLIFFVNIGLPSTSFNVFQPYLADLPYVGHSNAAMVLAMRTFASLVTMFFVAHWYEKFNARMGVFIAALFTSAGFFLYSFATNLPLLFAGAVLAGVGYSLGGMVAITIIVHRWFITGVGTAVGIATMGSGISSLILPPITAQIIEQVSLSWAFRFEAIVALVFALIIFALLRDTPAEMGMTAYNAPEKKGRKKVTHGTLEKPLPNRVIALMTVAITFVGCIAANGYGYFSILLTTEGVGTLEASWILSVLGLSLTLGKAISGVVCDNLGTRNGSILLFGLAIVGLALCSFGGAQNVLVAVVTAILFGSGASLGSLGISLWSMEFCTEETLTHTVRNFQIAYAIGAFAFNFIPGTLMEITGTYTISYLVLLVMACCSFAIVLYAYEKRRAASKNASAE